MADTYSTSTKRNRLYRLTPLSERYWQKVIKADGDGCWGWNGSADRGGYGQIRDVGKFGKLLKAHRVSWELHNGPIPDGMLVCHKCDNPACTRPDHLFIGTLSDNSQDSASKGRGVFQKHPEKVRRGEKASGAKLSVEAVAEVHRLRADGWTQCQLAERFGVTQAAIWYLLKGRTWKTAETRISRG